MFRSPKSKKTETAVAQEDDNKSKGINLEYSTVFIFQILQLRQYNNCLKQIKLPYTRAQFLLPPSFRSTLDLLLTLKNNAEHFG